MDQMNYSYGMFGNQGNQMPFNWVMFNWVLFNQQPEFYIWFIISKLISLIDYFLYK
jgi:hypothetical protein